MCRTRLALSLLLSAATLSGCGKFLDKFGREEKNGFTEVKFGGAAGQISLLDSLNGGMMIYALGQDGSLSYRSWYFPNESAAMGTSVTLPNGIYRFVAFGFVGTAMTSNNRCGEAAGGTVNLSGAAATVNIALSYENCTGDAFVTAANVVGPPPYGVQGYQFISCNNATNIDGFTSSSDCTTTKGGMNHTRSIKVTLVTGSSMGSEPTLAQTTGGLSGACIVGAGNPSSNALPGLSANSTALTAYVVPDSSTILFGSNGSSIKRSIDGGASFSTVGTFGSDLVLSLHGTSSLLFAATDALLYKSTDDGASWSSVGGTGGTYDEVYVSGTKVLAGRSGSGDVYYATDATSFTGYTVGSLSAVNAVFIDDDGTLYAGGAEGADAKIYKSINGGTSWTPVYTGTSEGSITRLRKVGGKFYYTSNDTTNGGFGISTDNAATFTKYCSSGCANTNLPSNQAISFDVADGTIYVGTSSGMGVTVNGGATWASYGASELGVAGQINGLSYGNGRLFYAMSYGDSYRSTDSRGTGAAFPSVSSTMYPRLAVGGTNAGLKAFAAKVEIFSDAACTNLSRTIYFPKGVGNGPAGETSNFTARMVYDGSYGKFFIRDN